MRMLRLAFGMLVLLACASSSGCEDDLPKATEIARMRVLGAWLSVEGDPQRATPRPGETVNIAFPIVFPTLEQHGSELQSLLIGCTAPNRFTGGLPVCQELIDAALSGEDLSDVVPMIPERVSCESLARQRFAQGPLSFQCLRGEPVATIAVPQNFKAEALLFRGVICERGSPYVDPNDPLLFSCTDETAEAIRLHGTITVQHRARDANHNPDLSALELRRETVPWPEYDPEALPREQACRVDLPNDFSDPVHLVVTGRHRIALRYRASALERVEGGRENLEITVYTTHGEMERRFTLFQGEEAARLLADSGAEDPVLESEIEWRPPKHAELRANGGSQLVRFFITLRDQRGGFAITSRAVCVH